MPTFLALAGLVLPLQTPSAEAPEEPRGLRLATPVAQPGYTLYSPLTSKHTYLVDLDGREVHRWTSGYAPSSVYLLDDGSILRTARLESEFFEGGGMCGRIERIAWDGTLVWEYELSDDYQMQHHDAHPMPNGNVLLITWEHRFYEDCVAAGRDPARTPQKGLWPDAVLEVAPTLESGGEVVWEWHAWDHLVQDFDPERDNFGVIAEHAGRFDVNYDHRGEAAPTAEELERQREIEEQMRALGYTGGDDDDEEDDGGSSAAPVLGRGSGPDWMHTNGVDYDPVHDLIALSSPNLSEIWIVDHSTTTEQAAGSTGGRFGKGGEILWRWGNPRNHGAGTEEDQRLFFQHHVQFIRPGLPGAGNLLVFNNGQERASEPYSSVDELVLPFDPAKGFLRDGLGPFGPAEPVWSYSAPDKKSFYASFISGCQRLPNGNTLVVDGPKGRIFEVQRDGTLAWDYWNPHGGDVDDQGLAEKRALFRAARIPPDHPAVAGRTLAPLEPAK